MNLKKKLGIFKDFGGTSIPPNQRAVLPLTTRCQQLEAYIYGHGKIASSKLMHERITTILGSLDLVFIFDIFKPRFVILYQFRPPKPSPPFPLAFPLHKAAF